MARPKRAAVLTRPSTGAILNGTWPETAVRVWWAPTKDPARTGYSGAFWPAVVSRKGPTWVEVIYDNGEVERVHADDIFPADVPVDFGMELLPLQVGEFVEVSNASSTDPGAWLGVVAAVGHVFRIDYPFHDSPSELVRPELLRRARIWDEQDWRLIEMWQTWKPGEVTSPLELHLLDEADYFLLPSFVNVKRQQEQQQRQQQQQQTPQQSAHQRLQEQLTAQLQMPPVRAGLARLPMQVRAAAAAAARFLGPTTVKTPADVVESAGSGSVSELGREGSSDGAAFAARRARKPAQPRRATLDDASSGGAEKNKDVPHGAKRRKPSVVKQSD